jgi:hypothetical protein
MYANAVIPSDEAAWITAISKDVVFAVVAGCADVIRPCDVARSFRGGPGTTLDICGGYVFTSPAGFGLLRQRKSRWLSSIWLVRR